MQLARLQACKIRIPLELTAGPNAWSKRARALHSVQSSSLYPGSEKLQLQAPLGIAVSRRGQLSALRADRGLGLSFEAQTRTGDPSGQKPEELSRAPGWSGAQAGRPPLGVDYGLPQLPARSEVRRPRCQRHCLQYDVPGTELRLTSPPARQGSIPPSRKGRGCSGTADILLA